MSAGSFTVVGVFTDDNQFPKVAKHHIQQENLAVAAMVDVATSRLRKQ